MGAHNQAVRMSMTQTAHKQGVLFADMATRYLEVH